MALPLRSSPHSLELRREWPEYAELIDDSNDKRKRYVGYQSELSSKGIVSSPNSAGSIRLEEYFKEYRIAKCFVEKFELLAGKRPKELRKLLDFGMRFEDACEGLLTAVAKGTTVSESTASEEEVESQSGLQTASDGASIEQSNGRCSSPTGRLAAAIIAAVKKEEPREEETLIMREAYGEMATMPDLMHAQKSAAEAIPSPWLESLPTTSDAAMTRPDGNGSDNGAATFDGELPASQRSRRRKRRSWLTPKKMRRKAPISAKKASKPLIAASKPITSPTFYHTSWESFAQLKYLRLQLQSATRKGTTEAESDVGLQVACIRALIRHAREPLHDLLGEGRTVEEIIASLESKLPFALLRKLRER
ncbi:hypothetical protein AAVH_16738 [Aphelenchoides avenae]|nr:hypothetical protein AAVH_16738 [Aphelenchus avenae]